VELVDRTRTRVGREQLRRRLRTPADSVDAILALQQAHRLLAAEAQAYRWIVDRADADGAERYLGSNWRLPPVRQRRARFVATLWRGGWRGAYLSDVREGQTRVVALLKAAADLQCRLSTTEAAVLHEVARQLAAVLDTPEVRELIRLASRRSGSARLAFDQLARQRAKPLLTGVLESVGTVEAMWSLAIATTEHGWSYPTPSSRLTAVRLRHPFLGPPGVPYDIELNDQVRVCFVTGANMAGKSTFLRTVALSMLLAHVGCGVPAESLEFPVARMIFSSLKVSENLAAGESFYLAEVRRIRALAMALHQNGSVVAVLDEPLRGTNVHDAVEATLAIITRLAVHPEALVFIASHLAEVVPGVVDDPRIRLLHFAADLTDDQPRFDYRLREGVSAQRLGMTLLRQERVLDLLDRREAPANLQPNTALHPTAAGAILRRPRVKRRR